MTQIRIDTEYAREVGRRLLAEGDRFSEIGYELQRAIGSLDTWAWDGASRWRAEPLLGRVRPESTAVAEELDRLGRTLVRVADVFEQVDNTTAQGLGDLGWGVFEEGGNVTDLTGVYIKALDKVAGKVDDVQDAVEILASVVVAPGLTKGYTYFGQTIVHGDSELKDLAGLSKNLTHIKASHIPSHMRTQAFKGELSRSSILLEGIREVAENWDEFKGDTSKVAIATVIETALGVSCTALGAGAGAWAGAAAGGAILGAVSGGALAPVGAVIGGKIGGVVGGWAGGKFAEWVEDWKIGPGGQELDQTVVNAVDSTLGKFANGVASLFD